MTNNIKKCLTYLHRAIKPLPFHAYRLAVLDISSYPAFLPWCQQTSQTSPNIWKMVVSFGPKRVSYHSKVQVEQGAGCITIVSKSLESDLFENLESKWKLSKIEQTTQVHYQIDFNFRSLVYQSTSQLFLGIVGQRMVKAFDKRSSQLQRLKANAPSNVTPLRSFQRSELEGLLRQRCGQDWGRLRDRMLSLADHYLQIDSTLQRLMERIDKQLTLL